jgi:hypothetical protein
LTRLTINHKIMKAPRVVAAILFLSLLPCNSLVLAGQAPALHATQKLLEIFPDSIQRASDGKKNTWSFCPDNTCIELEKVGADNIEGWGVVYLYYFGDYYELERWRNVEDVGTAVNELRQELQLSVCIAASKMDKLCLMDKFKKTGIKIYNVRYDEGKRVAERVN